MDSENSAASGEAGVSVPEPLARQIVAAAERGDRFAFNAAALHAGSLEEAQAIVRARGIVRMVDRVRSTPGPVTVAPFELRDANADGDPANPTMFGHFAVFNEWTEIDSWFEGHFMERIAPGAFKKTFRENRSEVRALFQHGFDPVVGDKPLGVVDDLREDEIGGYYEVPLLDAGYVRDDVLPGLRAGVYGASFRFQMIREEFDKKPGVSDHNPAGLPERTLKELRVFEFGPVTFPAYPAATASVRTTSEEATPPAEGAETTPEPAAAAEAVSHPDPGRRGQSTYSLTRKEKPAWLL